MVGLSLDDTSIAKYYRKLGKEEGKAEGKAEGRVEGKLEGEKLKAIEIAKNLLVLRMGVEYICRATQLTEDEVNSIKDKL